MTEEILEKSLREFDYSMFSKVKESLLKELLKRQRQNNLKNFKSFAQQLAEEKICDEELDFVVAAGNSNRNENFKKNI